MSEPTITQQIATALSSVEAQITAAVAALTQRVAWILTADLNTNGQKITNPELDEDDYAPDIEIESTTGIKLVSAGGTEVHRSRFPWFEYHEPPVSGILGEEHNGLLIACNEAADLDLELSEDIPLPVGAARWSLMIYNESTADDVNLTAGDETMNGSTDPIVIGPLECRSVSRRDDGFLVM